ncbi:MAG TPA: 2'-5' RNA ligase family protein [Kribbella sp.]|nr:2'-5' RNA ligase family protein [Kribbella sp.]
MIEEVRDHWWWRPGWRQGRSFYTWHITFADQPEIARLLASYRPVIDRLPGITPVPLQWLHLTMQGVGFTDRVDRRDVDVIVSAARARCAELGSFTATIGPARVDHETVLMPVRPVEPLQELRNTIRTAIADVWGPDAVPEYPGLRPHVSLGYWHQSGPAAPRRDVLASSSEHTAEVRVKAISLIELNRDRRMYEWQEVASVLLGAEGRRTAPEGVYRTG